MSDQNRLRKSRCLDDLKRRILSLSLEPGSALDETELAETYAMSRPPLREVIRQLAGEGYVVLRDNRGAIVAPMNHRTLRSFFRAAPMIHAAVARLAAENATSAQIMRLKDAQLLFRRAMRDGDELECALTNERFHAIIGEMADNEFLMPSLRRLLIDHTRIGIDFFSRKHAGMADARATSADQHDEFIALFEAGEADAAERLAVAHWELSSNSIEIFVTPKGLSIPLGPALDSSKDVA